MWALGPNKGSDQFFNISRMIEYRWDAQILHKAKSESKSKWEQKFGIRTELRQ